jgi:hypothetical protein
VSSCFYAGRILEEAMEGHYSSGRHMESAQSKDDLANQSLDVVVAKVLFVEPECCHRPPIFIE